LKLRSCFGMRSSRFYEKVCEPFNKERFEKETTHDLQFITDWNNFKMFQVYDTDGKLSKKSEHNLELIKGDYEELNGILKMIAKVEVIDDILLKAQRQGRITFMMGSFGETGGILGVTAGLKFTDLVMTQYREQCIFYYRGFPISAALDQCTGNKRCITLGRQMPHHYGFPEGNIAFVSSPLGTQISHAAGAGYGFRISGKDKICCVWFGEGCASEGDYHAGVNFGQTLGCQTLFVARNNKYAISTHQSKFVAPKPQQPTNTKAP
jgi:2-oxoisovalerate dehydrogenase E1 component alpha subunit